VKPQPKVTIIQSTPRQEPPPPKPRPQTQYYIPSNQAQQSAVQPQPTDATQTRQATPSPAAQPQPSKPLVARPVSMPLSSSSVPWGSLPSSDGQQVHLIGARAVAPPSAHDLAGVA